jgi:hypothetical protein
MSEISSEEQFKIDNFLKPLSSIEECEAWIYLYLGLQLPFTNVSEKTEDPEESTLFMSPGQAIWECYNTYKEDLYIENPGYIFLGSRDGAKTLAGSILNVLLVLHFQAEVAHLAAVKKQAEKCIEYTNGFLRKIKSYLEIHNIKVISDSKSKIQILHPNGHLSYIDVIVASLAGGNSQRSTVGSYDELDTLSRQGLQGYKEALLIPTRKNGHGPLSIKYSTRKFAAGVMENEIASRFRNNEKLIKWNILDITEKCFPERNLKGDGLLHPRYIKKQLPLKLYTQEDFSNVKDIDKPLFRKINLYSGCLKCPIAPICHGKLSERLDHEIPGEGSIFKTIDFTIGQFKKLNSDISMAEAQLLCWPPLSSGLVYPRFSSALGENAITITQAYNNLMGTEEQEVSFDKLVEVLHSLEINFFAGLDWGYTKCFALIIIAILPSGEIWIMDNFAAPGLELSDQLETSLYMQNKYNLKKIAPDTAYPGSIATFNKAGIKTFEFKKDVMSGIEAVRSSIINASGIRKLKVIVTENNKRILEMFKKHSFVLDNMGEPTMTPDDGEFADTADALRYIFQNIGLYKKGTKPVITTTTSLHGQVTPKIEQKSNNAKILGQEGNNWAQNRNPNDDKNKKKIKKGIFFG